MMVRTQVSLDRELHRRARSRAEELGISLAELTRRALESQLAPSDTERGRDISSIFALGDSGGADIAAEKDRYLAEAAWNEHLRKTGGRAVE